jgi:hypothetical protein
VKASKVAYKPVGLALGALSGVLAGGLFKQVGLPVQDADADADAGAGRLPGQASVSAASASSVSLREAARARAPCSVIRECRTACVGPMLRQPGAPLTEPLGGESGRRAIRRAPAPGRRGSGS